MTYSVDMTESNPKEITPSQRRALRARAHALEPVVLIGDKGLTATVLAEIERALAVHELIKVRAQAERGERARMLDAACSATGASIVQHIGKILVLYREKPPEVAAKTRPKARKSAPRGAADDRPASRERETAGRPRRPSTASARREAADARGTGRPGSRTASPRRAPARPLGRQRTSR